MPDIPSTGRVTITLPLSQEEVAMISVALGHRSDWVGGERGKLYAALRNHVNESFYSQMPGLNVI